MCPRRARDRRAVTRYRAARCRRFGLPLHERAVAAADVERRRPRRHPSRRSSRRRRSAGSGRLLGRRRLRGVCVSRRITSKRAVNIPPADWSDTGERRWHRPVRASRGRAGAAIQWERGGPRGRTGKKLVSLGVGSRTEEGRPDMTSESSRSAPRARPRPRQGAGHATWVRRPGPFEGDAHDPGGRCDVRGGDQPVRRGARRRPAGAELGVQSGEGTTAGAGCAAKGPAVLDDAAGRPRASGPGQGASRCGMRAFRLVRTSQSTPSPEGPHPFEINRQSSSLSTASMDRTPGRRRAGGP